MLKAIKEGVQPVILMILRVVFTIVAISFATYGLITSDFRFQNWMLFFFSLALVVTGIGELRKGHKVIGGLSITAFVFILCVIAVTQF